MGHSVGEYVAACIAGVWSLEDGLKLIATRGRLMQSLPSTGEMVAVIASEAKVRELMGVDAAVTIGVENGPEAVVLSGESGAMSRIVRSMESEGIKTKKLVVSHAFHSPLMEPMLAKFEAAAKQVRYNQPQIPIISNVTGLKADESIATAKYWVNHIREPVRFAQEMRSIEELGLEVFLEIGPKPVLLGMGRECIQGKKVWLPSLRTGKKEWQQILESLGKLYVQGFKINWQGVEKGYTHQKVVLPTYPFQRQRYWIENSENGNSNNISSQNVNSSIVNLLNKGKTEALAQKLEKVGNLSPSEVDLLPKLLDLLVQQHQQELTAASMKDWLYEVEWKNQARLGGRLPSDYLPTPLEMKEEYSLTLTEFVTEEDSKIYNKFLPQLENLSVDYIVQALQEISWPYKQGESFSLESATQNLGIVPGQERLFQRMLQILGEEGILQRTQQQWQVIQALQGDNPELKSQALLNQYPNATTELTLLHRCGSQLSGVLQGKVDPVELVFPEGDLSTSAQLYQESLGAKVMNTMVQKAIALAIAKLPKLRKIRLLEIGAGTGGTTSYILPHLPAWRTEYVFTDIGGLFTTKAQEKFRDYPFVRYQTLDIEIDPTNQGFEENKYDVIIAANVLHATSNMTQTMTNVQKLLAPGGILVLLEATTPQRWVDLIFGLLDGWWKFQDLELRSDHPLLSRNKWAQLLNGTGFVQDFSIPETDEGLLGQTVIIAPSNETSETNLEPTSSPSKSWLLLADQQGIAQKLANQLRSAGISCILVFTGEQYQQIAPEEFTINPERQNDYSQLLE